MFAPQSTWKMINSTWMLWGKVRKFDFANWPGTLAPLHVQSSSWEKVLQKDGGNAGGDLRVCGVKKAKKI